MAEARIGGARLGSLCHEAGKRAVLSVPCLPEAASALALALGAEGPSRQVTGVLGEAPAVSAFVEKWKTLRPTVSQSAKKLVIYGLSEVLPPGRPALGGMRLGSGSELSQLVRWSQSFSREARVQAPPVGHEAYVQGLIAEHRLFVWEDVGELKAMAALTGQTPRGVRVSLVFTPASERGQGYASALVAGLCQKELDQGRKVVSLFADLENPTSNSIYRKIGFKKEAEVEELLFGPG